MKTTIDIPDELYRRVKAKSALEGKRIRDLTIELYQRWLAESWGGQQADPEAWLRDWLHQAHEAVAAAPPGPHARELLEQDRERAGRDR